MKYILKSTAPCGHRLRDKTYDDLYKLKESVLAMSLMGFKKFSIEVVGDKE